MARQVRIVGLIRAADTVRRELTTQTSTQQREQLRRRVQENLQQVQQILRTHNADLKDLPAPSQRAYQFLAGLEWSKLPTGERDEAPASGPTTLSWRGLSAAMDRMLNRLAVEIEETELNHLCDAIARTSRQIELTIQRRAVSPDRLSASTRAQRGWLGFFSREENLKIYSEARRTAGRLLDAATAGSRDYPPPMIIHFRPIGGIYKLRATRSGSVLWLPTPMVAFDEQAFESLAALIFNRGQGARQRVIELMTGDGYQAIRAELETLGGIVEQTRGAAHDLAGSFDRVNAEYFANTMLRPRLTWNRTFTGRKFGHYDWILDTVMVSRTLDSPGVPQFVVDFLVFHELLHKFHGLHWVNGRGYAHTTEFMQSERKFKQYAQAEAILQELARKVR